MLLPIFVSQASVHIFCWMLTSTIKAACSAHVAFWCVRFASFDCVYIPKIRAGIVHW